jgi:hypothetical protein
MTSKTPVLLVSRDCFSRCRRVVLQEFQEFQKRRLDSCFRRNDIRTFIYKGFRKNIGTGFTFCLALNVRKQKKTVPILKLPLQGCPLNARRVPFFAFQFSKNRQLRPLFLAYFCLSKITKPL